MDILIKSFNRPYYLDRCLYSIVKNVKLDDGKIIILDDGTPEIYLDKILFKYPNIVIQKSEFCQKKQERILKGFTPEEYLIPINLWLEAAKNASENFILLEDDFWFIDTINLNDIEKDMVKNEIVFLKLTWLGNPLVIQSRENIKKNEIEILKPKLFTIIPALYYFIFYKFDKFKIRKALRLLKINTDKKHLAYYSIYSVAGMIFNKNYFITLWDNHKNTIDEGLQIYNAVKFFNKHRNKIKFARLNREILKTGFVSSATNQFKEGFGKNIDMFTFNKTMNDAWLMDKMDVISSLPNEIDENSITAILDNDINQKNSSIDWKNWMSNFKNQYRSLGCKID